MKKLIFLIPFIVLCMACQKSTEPEVDDEKTKLPPDVIEFALFARESTIKIGTTTDITAFIDPPFLLLDYQWKASEGAILGSGQTVYFSNCCASKPKITCTISDKNGNKASKSIEITVID